MAGETFDQLEQVKKSASPMLYALSRGQADVQAAVPDLLGTVVEKVLSQLRAGRDIKDLTKYAKQVARNTYYDWHRENARRNENEDARVRIGPTSGAPSLPIPDRGARTPSSLAVEDDDRRRHAPQIEAVLATLSQRERDVLRLRFEEHLSSAEVANLLGYNSPAVVDTTVTRARRKLREQLPPSLISALLGE